MMYFIPVVALPIHVASQVPTNYLSTYAYIRTYLPIMYVCVNTWLSNNVYLKCGFPGHFLEGLEVNYGPARERALLHSLLHPTQRVVLN